MSPRAPTLPLVRLICPILLLLAVTAIAILPDAAHSATMEADGPGKGKAASQSDRPRNDSTGKHDQGSKNDSSSKDASGGKPDKQADQRSEPARPNAVEDKTKPDDRGQVNANIAPSSTPTPRIRPPVSIRLLAVHDSCRMSGTVEFSGPYTGSLSIALMYHVPGEGDFIPTGVSWSRELVNVTSADYQIPQWQPPVGTGDKQEGPNSLRLEIASANPAITNVTVKSHVFYCDTEQPPPNNGAQSTATSVLPATSTPASPADPTGVPTIIPGGPTPESRPTHTPVPDAAPTATFVPDPDESPQATPTLVLPNTQTPVTDATPTPTPTPTSTPVTVVPSCDQVGIEPDSAANADPGVEMAYWHTVTNKCPSPRTLEVAAQSSLGWPVSVFSADGETPLADSNHNGSVDTGLLEPGKSSLVVVRVAVPLSARRGQRDITTVTAEHAADGGQSAARDTTTVNGVITMSLSTPYVAFGGIAPSGSVALAAPGIWSSTDPNGASYVKSEAVRVTVSSNAAWTGTVGARENTGSATTIKIADGDLKWRSQGESDWSAFAPSPSEFAGGPAGVRSYSHDYGLSVSWDDDPGSFDTVITYNVTQ